MNSYQTANAAFRAAGLPASEGVKHGRGYFFRRAVASHPHTKTLQAILEQSYPFVQKFLHRAGQGGLFIEDRFDTGDVTPPADHPAVRECAYSGKRADVLIPDDMPDELPASIRRVTGTGAAAAGGTSWLRFVVKASPVFGKWDVLNVRHNIPQATFGSEKWARIAADAWNHDQSVQGWGRTQNIDVSGFTLA